MKNSKKKSIIALSLLGLCFAAIVGTTFALFNLKEPVSEVNINAAEIAIDLVEKVKGTEKLYSAVMKTDAGENEVECDQKGSTLVGRYIYQEQNGTFAGGNTCVIGITDKVVTVELDQMAPGDKVAFTIKASIFNSINAKCKLNVKVGEDETGDLDDYVVANAAVTSHTPGADGYVTLNALGAEAVGNNEVTFDISVALCIDTPIGSYGQVVVEFELEVNQLISVIA